MAPPPSVVNAWQKETSRAFRLAARTAQLGHWAFQLGAGTRTILCCADIVAGLVRLAELARDVADAAGGTVDDVRIASEALTIPHRRTNPLLDRAIAFTADQLCTETATRLAVHHVMLEAATVQIARNALERFTEEGERHLERGWLVLEGLVARADDELLVQARDDVDGWIDRVRSRESGLDEVVTGEEAAWGLVAPARAAAAVAAAVESRVRPELAKRLDGVTR